MSMDPQVTPSRRLAGPQLALVAGVALLVLLLVWFFLLRGAGAEVDETPAPAPLAEPQTPEPVPSDPPGGKAGKGPVETFEVFASRDPFDPLVSLVSLSTTTGGEGTTDTVDAGGTTITGGSDDDGTAGTGDAGTGDTGGTGTDAGASVGGHRVRVVDVYQADGREVAQVDVDGTVYKVDVGETFADNFELVSASGSCASMLFGDDQFTLCEGEEILK